MNPIPTLTDPDPYDGQPSDQPVQGPMPAGIMFDQCAEPTEVRTYDEAGFTRSRGPAPSYRCATCGRSTTRRVPVSFQMVQRHAGELGFLGEYRAECRACALERAERNE